MHWGDVLTLLRAPKMVNQPLIVSSPTAVQEVNKDIPEVEQNSSTDNTSVSSCVSSLTAVQDLMKTLPKLNRTETLIKLQCTAGTTVCLPTPLCRMLIKAFPVKSKGASAITTTVLLRLCLWFMTEENNSTALSWHFLEDWGGNYPFKFKGKYRSVYYHKLQRDSKFLTSSFFILMKIKDWLCEAPQ